MRGTTEPPWHVVDDYRVVDADGNLIADCRRAEDALLIARAPLLGEALCKIEAEVGDLPAHSKIATRIYQLVADAMSQVRIAPRRDIGED